MVGANWFTQGYLEMTQEQTTSSLIQYKIDIVKDICFMGRGGKPKSYEYEALDLNNVCF